jgi:predicted GIY-YIG superfamily endonuclease
MPWVYILRCADKSLYVGLSADIEAREQWHNNGFGSSYTANDGRSASYTANHFDLSKLRERVSGN